MTDKQIIIDGVDVSKCIYLQQEDDEYTCGAEECNGAITACRACDNCYYKQLKRKEQECERTKERLESFQKDYSKLYQVVENKGYIKQLDQLKAENKQLKEENFNFEEIVKLCRCEQYKQTLTEIKEIAEKQCVSGVNCIDMKQILQKISEVKDE